MNYSTCSGKRIATAHNPHTHNAYMYGRLDRMWHCSARNRANHHFIQRDLTSTLNIALNYNQIGAVM